MQVSCFTYILYTHSQCIFWTWLHFCTAQLTQKASILLIQNNNHNMKWILKRIFICCLYKPDLFYWKDESFNYFVPILFTWKAFLCQNKTKKESFHVSTITPLYIKLKVDKNATSNTLPQTRWNQDTRVKIFYFVLKRMGHPLSQLQRKWLEPINRWLFSTRKSGSSFSPFCCRRKMSAWAVICISNFWASMAIWYWWRKEMCFTQIGDNNWKFFFCYSFVNCWGTGRTSNTQFPCSSCSFLRQTGTCLSIHGWVFVNYKGNFLSKAHSHYPPTLWNCKENLEHKFFFPYLDIIPTTIDLNDVNIGEKVNEET